MLEPEIARLAARQHGVFNHHQAHALGLTDRRLLRLRRGGQVIQREPGVYLTAGAPDSWKRDVARAVLATPGSLASHGTAAQLRSLDGFDQGLIEVLTEHGRWRRRNVVVHQTKDLVAADIDVVAGIPCTSLVRTLVDLPAVTNEFRAGKALDHACRLDRSILQQVRQRHLEVARRGRNGTVALRAMLERRLGGELVDSGFETMAVNLVLSAGLPAPATQWAVRDGEFTAYLDLAWPDDKVGMECDSLAHHFGEHAHQWDRTRRRRLKLLGWDIYEYTYEDVTRRAAQVARELRTALT